MAGYQSSQPPTTQTTDGQPVHFEPDFSTTPKSVGVYIGAEFMGSWPNRAAAKAALKLVDVTATYVPRKRVKEQW